MKTDRKNRIQLYLFLLTCLRDEQDEEETTRRRWFREDNDRQRVLPVLQAICCWVGWGWWERL